MKKSLLFLPLALALWSCSDNDMSSNSGDNQSNGKEELRYIAVNIVSNGIGSRAADGYEDGTGSENSVTSVRFFLFNSDDECIDIVDSEPGSTDDTNSSDDIEKKLDAVIIFEGAEAGAPVQIVAVCNPPSAVEGLTKNEVSSPEYLQTVVDNYGTTASGPFIMSNSIYAENKSGALSEHVAFTVAECHESREAALADPVEIYVERVVAKTRVNTTMIKVEEKDYYSITNKSSDSYSNTTTATATIYDAEGNGQSKNIYLKLLGWDVSGSAPKSRLVKKIENSWTGDNFKWFSTDNGWNSTYRSFWAENPSDVDAKDELTFKSFNDHKSVQTSFSRASIYIQENASWSNEGKNPGYPTKLIVAAQLVDDSEDGIDLAWYKGNYYTMDQLLAVFATESNIYYSTDQQTYSPISTNDIEFVTSTSIGKNTEDNVNKYNAYVQFKSTESNSSYTWYTKSKGEYVEIEASGVESPSITNTINDMLLALGNAKVWADGYTYYWTDIAHLGNTGYGDKGIVRNHLYDFSLTSFVGFGIPVLNPEEEIDPEEPDDPDLAYVAAEINILSWRVVTQSQQSLGWDPDED